MPLARKLSSAYLRAGGRRAFKSAFRVGAGGARVHAGGVVRPTPEGCGCDNEQHAAARKRPRLADASPRAAPSQRWRPGCLWSLNFDYCPEEKMFGFHKPKMYRSIEGCCICRAKSSSSRFTDSKRYEKDFQSCFGLHETRSGDICNACVLLVKRWKKLPAGSKKNWNHVVDARAGPSLKTTLKPKKVKTLSGNRIKSNQISKLQKEFKRHNSDAHSTTSSASPAQSPCYSNQSDDGSDTEMASGSNRTPVFSFLDLTYWKRQKICCGIIYKGRFGEVLIDTHLFKPCCSNKKAAAEKPEEQGPEPLPISTQEW
ncbi:SIN3-HDAC complex-associated factor [Physeter macrocephalus]|uniref:SIN3-HDAC complex-associated factor n=1 Tax=Physeter macrocephalus TaxID=9755 RepID=A0A2Y9F950_PHYMC|nr:SIN3-HDAC complex-associated factor [Physeter catodon]|eukprot:XP_007117606.1 SIN3-HDAC complex-associated factor isoform X2 [Physeter catodon]